MIIQNNGKNPNKLHDYLIFNNCSPNYLGHNAEYNENGIKTKEATEIYIEIEEEKQEELITLVNHFMSQ